MWTDLDTCDRCGRTATPSVTVLKTEYYVRETLRWRCSCGHFWLFTRG